MNTDLIETLRDAQRLGFFGPTPIESAAAHAQGFVTAIGPLPTGSRIVDLGSGGGLPGLVLADRYRECEVLLVDRRAKRTDFLERAVQRLRYEHVTVRCVDARAVRRGVAHGELTPFDAVTARGFGPPELTLRLAAGLCADAGQIVISEPPSGDRWPPDLLTELGLFSERVVGVRTFRRFT